MRQHLSPEAEVQTTIGHCVLEAQFAREVAMNSPVLVSLVVIVLVVGSTLSIMNKACKSGYHAWCRSDVHRAAPRKNPAPNLITKFAVAMIGLCPLVRSW